MKILFTGGSSFSGMWFVEELVKAGHSVTVVFRGDLSDYEGVRRQRVDKLLELCPALFSMSFGDESFVQAIAQHGPWDLYCHHAADVTDYRNPSFDVVRALANNTYNLRKVLEVLKQAQCAHVLLTGSVFEQREGEGSDDLCAVSPYGLSKGLTSDVFAFHMKALEMKLGKFVIPNPFGPYEEGRFTTYLMESWLKGEVPAVKAPEYVRDNIPVSLLAKAYRSFAERLLELDREGYELVRSNPSCYVGTQGDFTKRLSEAMQSRFDAPCAYEIHQQTHFGEPLRRVNSDVLDWEVLGWDEERAWNDFAEYALKNYDRNVCYKK